MASLSAEERRTNTLRGRLERSRLLRKDDEGLPHQGQAQQQSQAQQQGHAQLQGQAEQERTTFGGCNYSNNLPRMMKSLSWS